MAHLGVAHLGVAHLGVAHLGVPHLGWEVPLSVLYLNGIANPSHQIIFYLSVLIILMSTYTYHLSLGSNLGDRATQLSKARDLISTEVGSIMTESSIYETQPWGMEDQPWFLNQVIAVQSELDPSDVLSRIKKIEIQLGRLPAEKWHARHIDIDILLSDDKVIEEKDLIIPHPHFHERNFTLVPLMEIAGQLMHPVFQKTIEELYEECRDTGEVYIFNADEQDNPL